MGKAAQPALLQGTLDLLILHALQRGALHGYAIAQTIHLLSDEVLKVEEGSLYPALWRLELDGAISLEIRAFGEQPEGQVLPDHQTRAEAARRAGSHLDEAFGRRRDASSRGKSPCFDSFENSSTAAACSKPWKTNSPSIARWRGSMATPSHWATPR